MFNPTGVDGFCWGFFPRARALAVNKISSLRLDRQVFYVKKIFCSYVLVFLGFFFDGRKDINHSFRTGEAEDVSDGAKLRLLGAVFITKIVMRCNFRNALL